MLNELQRQQAHEAVQERVKAYILENELKPGDGLPSENQLAASLGVSRSAVREALRGLEATGMIESRHGVGRRVKAFEFRNLTDTLAYSLTVDLGSVTDLLAVRRALELAFLPDAIAAMTPDRLALLDAHVTQMRERIERNEPFVTVDMDFHRLLFQGVENRVLQDLLAMFWRLFLGVEGNGVLPPGNQRVTVDFHAAIVEAVRNQDVHEAKEVMDEHFRDVERRLEEAQRR
ncbi:MAG: FadR/GntR family transcriptional regulator [Trueperaceae bacterium]